MTIFNLINSLFFSKKRVSLSLDTETIFSPFMINRWMSMYSNEMLVIINETSNRYISVFKDKNEQYDWYYNFFPKLRFKKISYIKKNKKEKELIEESDIPVMAKNREISIREIKLYKDFFES